MTDKKIEDIHLGQRIKDIRTSLKMNQKAFSNTIGSTVSALSNWENGRNKPNDIMLREIARLGKVSVNYLINGAVQLEKEILDSEKKIQLINLEITEIDEKMNILKEKTATLSDEIEIDKIEDQLLKLSTSKLTLINIRDNNESSLNMMKKVLQNYKNGKSFTLTDRNNPEFEEHGISQFQISENLKTVPYILNYESTMKIVEYAQMLTEKEENLFKPDN